MSRIRSLDLARGFTVLMIAPVHTVLLYSHPSIEGTWSVKVLSFIAEGPGAQLFMCLMGVYVALSRTIAYKLICKRSLLLLLAGYALNVSKFVFPFAFGVLPGELMHELRIPMNKMTWFHLLSIGDIFHFAALALLPLCGLKQYKGYPYIAILATLISLGVSPLLWDVHIDCLWIDQFLKLFVGQPPQAFFPFFPWVVYPLSGLTIGYFLKRNAEETFRVLRDLGVILLLIHFAYRWLVPLEVAGTFYRTQTPETLWHLGIVFLSLFVWHWISKCLPVNRFFNLLQYSSRHITKLYGIQWIVIMWLLPVVGYQQHQLRTSIILIIITTGLTYTISYLIDAYNEFASVTNK